MTDDRQTHLDKISIVRNDNYIQELLLTIISRLDWVGRHEGGEVENFYRTGNRSIIQRLEKIQAQLAERKKSFE